MSYPPRSEHWHTCEHAFMQASVGCVMCGRKDVPRNAHHIVPYHFLVTVGRPDLECDPRILADMCVEHEEEHHLLVGHLGSFESYNPKLMECVEKWRGFNKLQIQIRDDYRAFVADRPKPLHMWSEDERKVLKAYLDEHYPPLQPSA